MHRKLHLTLWSLLLTLLLAACGGDATRDVPTAPTGLTATPGEGVVTLRWQDRSDNETGFTIYRREASTDTASVDSTGLGSQQASAFSKLGSVAENVTEYEDTSVTPGTLYRYGVTADGEVSSSAMVATEENEPVAAGNRAPSANGQSLSTPEDAPIAVTLTGSDPDGDALTYTIVTAPAYGKLSGDAPKLLYTPKENYNGKDSFTFTVSDGKATSAAATVTLTIGDVNDAPTANDKEVSTEEDTPVTITLTGSDPDGDALTFAIATQPSKGGLGTINQSTGEVTYTPGANENGADTFTFTVSDGEKTSAPATVTVNLNVVNDAPVAKAQQLVTPEDTPLDITLSGSDADGDALTYEVVTEPEHGSLSFPNLNPCETNLDGSPSTNCAFQPSGLAPSDARQLTYTPDNNYVGPDSFTFKANDGLDDSAEVTVSITVTAVNDAPSDITLTGSSVAENEPAGTVVGSLSASDIDSTSFTYSLVAGAGDDDNASFSISGDELKTAASFDFETKSSYSVRVQVSDGDASFEEAFTVTVTDVDERLVVTTEADNGAGSLRQVASDALAGETITFASTVQTVLLTGSEIVLNKNLTIQGDVIIDAHANSRIFNVSSGATVVLKDLTLTNGNASNGGGIYNNGTLTLQGDASISNNTASNKSVGGGVYNSGTLTLQGDASISGNNSTGNDGGVFNLGTLTMQDSSSVSGNTATMDTAGMYNGGTLTMQDNSSVSDNTSGGDAGGVYNDGTLTLSGAASISNNTAANSGGGVVIRKGAVTLKDNSSISNNSATNGGGVYKFGGTLNGAVYDQPSGNNIFDNTPNQVAP